MAINNYHKIEELNGVRCSLVESKISTDRLAFVKNILESSGLQTIVVTNEDGTSTIGVTDVKFNPIHALYARSLRTSDKKLVTPSYWYTQKFNEGLYWNYVK